MCKLPCEPFIAIRQPHANRTYNKLYCAIHLTSSHGPFEVQKHNQAVQQRKEQVRGGMSIDQTENSMFISESPTLTAKRPRLNFPKSTTAGTGLAPAPLPEWTNVNDTWCDTIANTKIYYGEARIRPGGPVDGVQRNTQGGKTTRCTACCSRA